MLNQINICSYVMFVCLIFGFQCIVMGLLNSTVVLNMSGLLTKYEFRMAGYWPSSNSFFVLFIDREEVEVQKKNKNKNKKNNANMQPP